MDEDFQNIDKQLPYNPTDVDIRQQKFAVYHLMKMIRANDIELLREVEFQRKSSWSDEQRSRLIESLIMRIPLPIFYFDGSELPWKVIDGLHRLSTLYLFINGSLRLKGLEYLTELENKSFFDLPFKYQRVIEESTIEAYVINPGTPDKVKLNIFQRINTGGSALTHQEIRNAYYRGKPIQLIDALATDEHFLLVTRRRISSTRMRDREVVLRFFSFYKFFDQYTPPMEKFLDVCMEQINKLEDGEIEHIKRRFSDSMITIHDIFEDRAFYTLNIEGQKQGSTINIALFEAWAVCMAQLEYSERERLINSRDRVVSSFIRLLQDIEFHKSISSSTSSKKAVYTRFSAIHRLIKNILNAH